ncbi:unnamed protein product [Amaranthus hypochondriacus]
MQGQRSAIGSLPDSINFDYGSPSSNVGMDQQICWNNIRNPPENRVSDLRISATNSDNMGGVSREGIGLSRWTIGEQSSSINQNVVSSDDQLTQSGWSTSMNGSGGIALRLEEQRYDPAIVSQNGVNLNISSNQVVVGPSFMQSSDPNSGSQRQDLSDRNFLRVGDVMDCPNSSKSNGSRGKFLPSTSSSDPFASSGSGGFLVEEDECRRGCLMDGRRLSCKRKTLEGNAGQSSGSGNCFSQAENSSWHAVPPRYDASGSVNAPLPSEGSPNVSATEQVNSRLGLGMGGGVPADIFRPVSLPAGSEISQRSYRLRMNPSIQQGSMPNNSFSLAPNSGDRRPDIPSAHQPLGFLPFNPPIDLMSPILPESSVPQSQSGMLRVSALQRNSQVQRWNGSPNLRPGSSSSPVIPGDRDAVLPEDLNSRTIPRNITEHPLFVPPAETRNSAQSLTNWNVRSGNVGISRNIPSSSRTGSVSASASHTALGPSWAPHRHSPAQYSRRLSEYVRRSLLSTVGPEMAGQSSSNNQLRSGPANSPDGMIPSIGANQGHNQSHSRSALWTERHEDGALGTPYSLRALAAVGEGRSRLVSELRNVLDMMRRGEGLRFEDVMLLDHSVLFGMADIHDQHRDMRLDVDNMSYEELLALEERIGNVCTGLTVEKILSSMKQCKYIHTMSDDQIEPEPCCICQEEYTDGEDIGTLDCGHDFHRECIKQWLTHKNLCPICKTTGLAA